MSSLALVFRQAKIYCGNTAGGDSVSAERKYHHGNLREAFIDAARNLLESDGLAGLSLRKCAERVGVSHTAPKNHFGNMAGLLLLLVMHHGNERFVPLPHLPLGSIISIKLTDNRFFNTIQVKFTRPHQVLYLIHI